MFYDKSKVNDETGASSVEYGLLIALIAAVIIVAIVALGGGTKGLFQQTCENARDDGHLSATCS
jgi:pilus assembly protein Flp/PilA